MLVGVSKIFRIYFRENISKEGATRRDLRGQKGGEGGGRSGEEARKEIKPKAVKPRW